MKVKCRGYAGELVYLYTDETLWEDAITGGQRWTHGTSSIEIRVPDGAKIELKGVLAREIEVIHED